jgi:beta-lactamase superfamily II metal-dependent hydrolase
MGSKNIKGNISQPQPSDKPDLRLRMVQAGYGDCLILEADSAGKTHYILVDGGPDGVFTNHLKPELQEIARQNGRLDLVVLSHIDEDHVVGLVDLMVEITQAMNDKVRPLIEVGELWYNTFRPIETDHDYAIEPFLVYLSGPFAGGVMQSTAYSISQGEDLWKAAMILNLPLNRCFTSQVVSTESAPRPLEINGLKLWVIGPLQKNLEHYRQDWQKWYDKHKDDPYSSSAVREALKTDTSVSNLSSIIFLAETPSRRILMTGDGRGEDVIAGLKQTGLAGPDGKLHVDVLKIPHHGSSRNSSKQFFQTITADLYVIPAGKHKNDGNPDLKTLVWIIEAAHKQNRPVEILIANPSESTKTLIENYSPAHYGYRLSFLKPDLHSMVV